MAQLRIGCVVMAAGNARRFGENKLAVQVQGKALFHRAREAVPAEQFVRTVVVSQYPEVLELAHRMGFVPVPNRHPDWGISHTISLGLGKLPEMDAAQIQEADQPLLRRECVGSLVDFYREHPEHISALGHGGVRGNPCLFPARLFPELQELARRTNEISSHIQGFQANVCLNYGGRDEIVRAARKLAADAAGGRLLPEEIDEARFAAYLDMADLPEVDLIIRPSGEKRLSNFMLWQAAYAEFWYSDICWPDFKERDMRQAIYDYQNRDRRFGGVK